MAYLGLVLSVSALLLLNAHAQSVSWYLLENLGSTELNPSLGFAKASNSSLISARTIAAGCGGNCEECHGPGYTLCPGSVTFCYLPGDSVNGIDTCAADPGVVTCPFRGSTCAESCGSGYIRCSDSELCYNPNDPQHDSCVTTAYSTDGRCAATYGVAWLHCGKYGCFDPTQSTCCPNGHSCRTGSICSPLGENWCCSPGSTSTNCSSCARKYGTGWASCGESHCYNQAAGDDCCSDGRSCEFPFTCSSPVGKCCRAGVASPGCPGPGGGGGNTLLPSSTYSSTPPEDTATYSPTSVPTSLQSTTTVDLTESSIAPTTTFFSDTSTLAPPVSSTEIVSEVPDTSTAGSFPSSLEPTFSTESVDSIGSRTAIDSTVSLESTPSTIPIASSTGNPNTDGNTGGSDRVSGNCVNAFKASVVVAVATTGMAWFWL